MIGQRLIVGGLAVSVVGAVAGCGSNGDYQNKLRPPALFVVTASVTSDRVSVSPRASWCGSSA